MTEKKSSSKREEKAGEPVLTLVDLIVDRKKVTVQLDDDRKIVGVITKGDKAPHPRKLRLAVEAKLAEL